MARPQIVVERSPWQTFFEELPDIVLLFHKLKLQAEEAEKNRQFQRANIYIKDLHDSKRLFQKATIDAMDDARDRGVTIDSAWAKLVSSSPENTTSGFENLNQYVQMDLLQGEVDKWKTSLEEINTEIMLANEGAKIAEVLDKNFNSTIDEGEIKTFEANNPEYLKELGFTEFPRSIIEGATARLLEPKVRERQKENKVIDARLNIIKGWDLDPLAPGIQLDSQDERFAHQKRALTASLMDPSSKDVQTEILNAISAEEDVNPFKLYGQTWTSVGTGYSLTPEGKAEIEAGTIIQHPDKYRGMWFRTEYPAGISSEERNILKQRKDTDKRYRGLQNNLRGIGKRAGDAFNKNLAWDPFMEELPGADTFHELGPTHRKNIAKNFATWFTQETQEGNDADNDAPGWMAKVFYANGGWEDVERAVISVMDDTRFAPIISDPAVLEKTFDWKGTKYKEDAANEFFMRSYEMFNLTETALGRGGDYPFLKGVSKVGKKDLERDAYIDDLMKALSGSNNNGK